MEEFIELVHGSSIERVVDVRKLPGSTTFPQFNRDALDASLASQGIEFVRAEALTGRRPVSKTIPFEVNAWWQNRSFHNYADHALSADYCAGLTELREQAASKRTVLMCAEAVWWRCHRRIIADHLLAQGETVLHMLGPDQIKPAALSAGAVVGSGGAVTYPARQHIP